MNDTPPPIINLTSPLSSWSRLVALYVDPRDNAGYHLEAILTPEWITVGGWEYVSYIVDKIIAEMTGPLGRHIIPSMQWRVIPFHTHVSPVNSRIIVPK